MEDYPHPDGLERVSCMDCHDDDDGPVETYRQSTHGLLAEQGDPLAPVCQDCHGSHDILPLSDPNSAISPFNVPAMCAQCHAEGTEVERAYDLQQQILRTIQRRFSENGHNFKLLVREIVLSPYFRAKNSTPLTADMETELSTFGTSRLLTPEHLSRKIEATTGVRWRPGPDRQDYLLDQYGIFYGGIDSDLVTQRVTEPNGVMASLGVTVKVSQQFYLRAAASYFDLTYDEDNAGDYIDPPIRLGVDVIYDF